MTLGHNLALGSLPFPAALNFQGGGQGIPGLHGPFSMQAGLGLGIGGMMAAAGARPGVAPPSQQQQQIPGPEFMSLIGQQQQHQDVDLSASRIIKDSDRQMGRSRSRERGRRDRRPDQDTRKRPRSSSNGESDDDIMVLSNSPGSSGNETSTDRRGPAIIASSSTGSTNTTQTKPWDNPAMMSMVGNGALGGFPMHNPGLVNGSMYPGDPSSLMAAMGSQMPFDVSIEHFTQIFLPTTLTNSFVVWSDAGHAVGSRWSNEGTDPLEVVHSAAPEPAGTTANNQGASYGL